MAPVPRNKFGVPMLEHKVFPPYSKFEHDAPIFEPEVRWRRGIAPPLLPLVTPLNDKQHATIVSKHPSANNGKTF